jgi:hypothetical protein
MAPTSQIPAEDTLTTLQNVLKKTYQRQTNTEGERETEAERRRIPTDGD